MCVALVLGIIRVIEPKPLSSKSFIVGCLAFAVMIIGFFDLNAPDSAIFREDYGTLNWFFIIPVAAIISITGFAVSNIRIRK
jgi:UDP-N-acetylmuramyl pentapeptide phosphotransferase/UDP-N-acetylglucosamine-1-phosphate transferase